jgi:putative phage-type endonuclease
MELLLRDGAGNPVAIENAPIHPSIQRVLNDPICQLEQGTAEWLDARKMFPVTGSACGIITGEDKSKSMAALFREKTGRGPPGTGTSYNCRQGHLNEPIAQSKFIKETGKAIFNTGLVPHPVYDFIAMSPDGLTLDGELLEIKCPVSRVIGDFVPVMYNPQLQLGMEVFDMEVANFVQFKPESEYRNEEYSCIRVARDRAWFQLNLPKFRDFAQKVRAHNALPVAERVAIAAADRARVVTRKPRCARTRLGTGPLIGVSLSRKTGPGPAKIQGICSNIGKCLLK